MTTDRQVDESLDVNLAPGMQIEINDRPALYFSDGACFNGFVPYRELIP